MSMKRVVLGLVVVLALGMIATPSHAFLFGGMCGSCCTPCAPYNVTVSYEPIEPQPMECTYCTCLPYGCPDGAPMVGACGPAACGPMACGTGCAPACGTGCGFGLGNICALPGGLICCTTSLVGGVLDCAVSTVGCLLGSLCCSPCAPACGPCGPGMVCQ